MLSGQVKKYPGQSRIGSLFTVGQKYIRVRSGPISSACRWSDNKMNDKNCIIQDEQSLN